MAMCAAWRHSSAPVQSPQEALYYATHNSAAVLVSSHVPMDFSVLQVVYALIGLNLAGVIDVTPAGPSLVRLCTYVRTHATIAVVGGTKTWPI